MLVSGVLGSASHDHEERMLEIDEVAESAFPFAGEDHQQQDHNRAQYSARIALHQMSAGVCLTVMGSSHLGLSSRTHLALPTSILFQDSVKCVNMEQC